MTGQSTTRQGAGTQVRVTATQTARVVVYPPHYWQYNALHLYYNNPRDASVDTFGAARFRHTATAPLQYVKELQADLITIGYLERGKDTGYYDGQTGRAVRRLQRHARRDYRMRGTQRLNVNPRFKFTGAVTGICDPGTAAEVRKWVDNSWVDPVNWFPTRVLRTGGGTLRFDAANEWEGLIARVHQLGGTLLSPYGDTLRPWGTSVPRGASRWSFHYTGRAVDINQGLGGTRYFCVKEPVGGDLFFRIYCKTDLQNGTQGSPMRRGQVKHWLYPSHDVDIPAGYYFDLTGTIEGNSQFRRIRAHSDYMSNPKGAEWWHFQYSYQIQETFEDELELIGHTEAQIKRHWGSDADLDHRPG